MENLEATGRVKGLLSRDERVNDEGQLEAVLETDYVARQGQDAVNELFNRVFAEKRSIVLPLVVGLAANVAAYALVVRPRGVEVGGRRGSGGRCDGRACGRPRTSWRPPARWWTGRPAPTRS